MVCGGSERVLKLVCGWLCFYEIRKTNQVLLLGVVVGCSVCMSKNICLSWAMGNELFGSRYGSFSSLTPPGIWAI